MEHGRDHEEREQKIDSHPNNKGVPNPADESDEQAQASHQGSDPAPTATAQRREAIRHRLEREKGHVAGGTQDHKRAENIGTVSREDLDAAAKAADEEVGGNKAP